MACFGDEHILRFDVTVHHLVLVQVLQDLEDFRRVEGRERLAYTTSVRVIPQLTALDKIEHEVGSNALAK